MIFKSQKNTSLWSRSFWRIEYNYIVQLSDDLSINEISVFLDYGEKYIFYGIRSIDEFKDCMAEVKKNKDVVSIIVFDGKVTSCEINKELDILSTRKLFVDFNLAENTMQIIINKNNINLP